MALDLDGVNDMYQEQLAIASQKDQEIRDLENKIEDLNQQLENQSFDTSARVRGEVAAEFEKKNVEDLRNILASEEKWKEFEGRQEKYMKKYTQ